MLYLIQQTTKQPVDRPQSEADRLFRQMNERSRRRLNIFETPTEPGERHEDFDLIDTIPPSEIISETTSTVNVQQIQDQTIPAEHSEEHPNLDNLNLYGLSARDIFIRFPSVHVLYLQHQSYIPLFSMPYLNIEDETCSFTDPNYPLLTTDTVGAVKSNVIAENLNATNVTYGYQHAANGRFFVIIAHSSSTFALLLFATVVQFKTMTIGGSLFGSLTYGINSRNHNHMDKSSSILNYTVSSLFKLLKTGALNGYEYGRVLLNFKAIRFTFFSSFGGRYEEPNSGARFYRWTSSTFSLDDFQLDDSLEDVREKIRLIAKQLKQELLERVQALDRWGNSEFEDADNSDIADFRTEFKSAEERLAYRFELFRRRLDEVTVYLLPRNYIKGPNQVTRPLNYRTQRGISDIQLGNLRMSAQGDAPPLRLHPSYNTRSSTNQFNATTNAVISDQQIDNLVSPPVLMTDLIPPPQPNLEFLQTAGQLQAFMDKTLENASLYRQEEVARAQTPIHANWTGDALQSEAAYEQVFTHDTFNPPVTDIQIEINPNADGGADINEGTKVRFHVGCRPLCPMEAYFLRLTHFWNPPDNGHNDCFLQCLVKAHNREENDEVFAGIKQTLELQRDDHIELKHVQLLSDSLNYVFHVWQIIEANDFDLLEQHPQLAQYRVSKMFKKLATFTPQGDTPQQRDQREHSHYLWYENHCYLMLDPKFITNKVKCAKCTQWICVSSFAAHSNTCAYCTDCRKAYSTKIIKETGKAKEHVCNGIRLMPKEQQQLNKILAQPIVCDQWVPARHYQRTKKLTKNELLWFADIETFPDPHSEFACTPYAIRMANQARDDEGITFYGEHCMEDFLGMLPLV
jgi:hypothetical protein